MNMIRKITNTALVSIGTFSLLASNSFAQASVKKNEIPNPIGVDSVAGVINKVSGFVQPILVITLLVLIFAAGFTRLTSAGDADKEQKSVKILTSAVIGFIIVVLAPLIIKIVSSILGVKDLLI